jgi:hypothetical protein
MDGVRIAITLAVFPLLLAAQVEYSCSDEDVQAFGLTCSEDEPCPVFLELASVESLGARLLVSGNLHTQTTTLYGILLASDDGGKTWTEPNKRMRSAALDQIQFLDLQRGWVSGVMLEPLPRDPFLLLTTDGGKTWRQRPLLEETRFGSIQQFWFDTPTSGELVLDRSQGSAISYERYESNTGGDSWEVKEVTNKPIRLSKGRPREDAAWRVRADSATKTYHVERRSAQKWETVATFDVHAGDCK